MVVELRRRARDHGGIRIVCEDGQVVPFEVFAHAYAVPSELQLSREEMMEIGSRALGLVEREGLSHRAASGSVGIGLDATKALCARYRVSRVGP